MKPGSDPWCLECVARGQPCKRCIIQENSAPTEFKPQKNPDPYKVVIKPMTPSQEWEYKGKLKR